MMLGRRRSPQFDKEDRNKSLLFVYGTLMHPKTRDYVLHHKPNSSRASVIGYEKTSFTTPEGKDFPSIEQIGTGELPGDVIEVSPEDLAKLKSWEDQYHLIDVVLKDGRYAKAFKLNKNDELVKGT